MNFSAYSKVSGARFWTLFSKLCNNPEAFFQRCYVQNMCPLMFLGKTGKNITPPELPAATRRRLNDACDDSLRQVVRLLGVRVVVAVGKYAYDRIKLALGAEEFSSTVRIEVIMHPSPANPTANKCWEEVVKKQLVDMGLMPYLGIQITQYPTGQEPQYLVTRHVNQQQCIDVDLMEYLGFPILHYPSPPWFQYPVLTRAVQT